VLIETFAVGPLGCNCSIVVDPASKSAVVIDPGGDFARIRARIEKAGATVTAVVHTHTHIDHVGATAEMVAWSGAPARIHEADRFLYDMLPVQAAMLGVELPEMCEVAGDLHDDTAVKAGAVELGVIHTPGHTPGSVSFLVQGPDGAVAFTGDTLFRRGIGRTDLWGGDATQIVRSLRRRLFTLDEATRVVPGHGPPTTIGEERRQNPFVRLV
jgi:glyoxylase-like metal-dependent hydrolase (beta-lactamase superfamily II)